jgi:hypothetical protein
MERIRTAPFFTADAERTQITPGKYSEHSMKQSFFVLITLITFCAEGKEKRVPTAGMIEYGRIAGQFRQLAAERTGAAAVENLTIRRDAAEFTLLSGKLYRLPPIDGNVHAMIFVGKGTATVLPPTDIEKKQLLRFYEDGLFPAEFKSLFLLFTDSTFTELSRRCSFTDISVPSEVQTAVKYSVKVFSDKDNDEIDADILRPFLYHDSNELFYAQFTRGLNESYYFEVDPYDDEEVSFGKMNSSAAVFSSAGYREPILQFHRRHEYTPSTPSPSDPKTEIDITHYSIDSRIGNDLLMSSSSSVTFTPLIDGRKWIPFRLYGRLMIDSIFRSDGRTMDFIRLNESGMFWLYDSGGFKKGASMTFTVHSRGEMIVNDEGWYDLRSSTGWYPKALAYREKATFDLRFTVPSKYQFASIGKKISSSENGENTVSEWKLSTPGRNASFMIGRFKEYSVTPDSTPPITVYIANAHDAQLRNYLASGGVLSGKDMDKQVAGDIENSIRFFQHLYGRSSVDHFYATEIPGFHGESFPGLVHLSWSTFQNTDRDGSDEIFRAHEVAHQWWATGVDFTSYHDQWISEGFATYSGLWYMQVIIHDNEKFFDQLRLYSKSILSNRKYLFGSGQEAGPIWLGYRTSSSNTGGDYNLIIYRKGAWVLHMLRNMGLDLKTMNEDLFKNMMKDFYQTYNGRTASTEDFQKMVEKHYKVPMNWFFKQWVYNTEIPTYNILYKLEKLENGKYKVKCTVKQSNVPDDFQMYVPFLVDFGENRFARVRYLIKGPVTEFEFPILPIKPEEIKFNDLESVLCEIDDEDWD